MHAPPEPVRSRTELVLWRLRRADRAVIVGFADAMPEVYRSRLTEMGFHVGETVTCLLQPAFGSPRVYRVSNTVYSLDQDIAAHIRVARDDSPQ